MGLCSLTELHNAADRAYRLARSLPDLPLNTFQARTAGLPRSTEAERLVAQRLGQDFFRTALLAYWNGRCPINGHGPHGPPPASHIVCWVDSDDDAHRLDVHNGLLVSTLSDAPFDRGLVSFDDDGRILISEALGHYARRALGVPITLKLPGLTDLDRRNLARHRDVLGPFAPYPPYVKGGIVTYLNLTKPYIERLEATGALASNPGAHL